MGKRGSMDPFLGHDNTNIPTNAIESAEGEIPPDYTEPLSKDVCFGYEGHPGTRAFRRAVKSVAADRGEEEYKPEIYKIIKKKLKGRRFFKSDDIIWAEASNLEARKEIGRAYDQARGGRSAVLEDSDPLSLPKL